MAQGGGGGAVAQGGGGGGGPVGTVISKIIMANFSNFMVKLYLNNRSNGLIDFPASDWYNKIPN